MQEPLRKVAEHMVGPYCRKCLGHRIVSVEVKSPDGKTVVEKRQCPECQGTGRCGYSTKAR